ncbi:hypothetical protein CPAR01_02060 [Colletotrichum paranaense]|uniref:Uncharacterized protein n=1 Tax=Colletotrichum paranaense TaxID=1914294 RepID=A0ABQ9SYF6_9PEZI|nr:uncharacterized protein CPAR01_02060 [Colletotrichum paranaense]KAK1544558.1 hypothetical protein CPAR01_02060 [Colletotrichum paranaense]
MQPLTSQVFRPRAFKWDLPFRSYEWEDFSYIDTLIDEYDAVGTPLDIFLNTPDHSPLNGFETPFFRVLCPDNILIAIRGGRAPDSAVAWLHDRSTTKGPRDYNGVKSARDFQEILKLKFLCEGQTSLVVSGWNHTVWTGCSLTDTYFYPDLEDPNNDELLIHYMDSEGAQWDAIAASDVTIGRVMITDPREYFLMVLRIRSKKCRDEWRSVLHNMRHRVEEYLGDPHIPQERPKATLGNADDQADAVEQSERWARGSSDILFKLIGALSKTITSWEAFSLGDAVSLQFSFPPSDDNPVDHMLYDIGGMFDDLRKILVDLKQLELRIERFKSNLQFVSPLALAGSIMQSGIVFQPSLLCFTVLAIGMGAITLGMKAIMTWYSQHCVTVRARGALGEREVAEIMAAELRNQGGGSASNAFSGMVLQHPAASRQFV